VDRRERRLARDEQEFRSSFSATEAARWTRFAIAPAAMLAAVDMEHGQTTYPSTFAEPLAYGVE